MYSRIETEQFKRTGRRTFYAILGEKVRDCEIEKQVGDNIGGCSYQVIITDAEAVCYPLDTTARVSSPNLFVGKESATKALFIRKLGKYDE